MKNIWQIWVDTGGTFTDCLALDPKGRIKRAKVLSNSSLRGVIKERINERKFKVVQKWFACNDFIKGYSFGILGGNSDYIKIKSFSAAESVVELESVPDFVVEEGLAFEAKSNEEAPVLVARLVTGTLLNKSLPPIAMRLATTRGTNALLEKRGDPPVLFITKGFGDLLEIGTQQRPDLFALNIVKRQQLYHSVIEIDERIDADGKILSGINQDEVKNKLSGFSNEGIKNAAIAFMHSYKNPVHEKEFSGLLRRSGFEYVSASAEIAPFIKILPRAETAVVDSYLSKIINDYLNSVKSNLNFGSLHVMTSAGGLVRPENFHPKDSLLSGPAGGVVGASAVGERSGFNNILAFDMGGTSTDVARYEGDFEYLFEHEVGDAHLVANALAIESVAAGGGSICSFDGAKLTVGPESAGAYPGPACYGAGGPLTITDVNLLLGRLDPDHFGIPVSVEHSGLELKKLIDAIKNKTGESINEFVLLEGFVDIANERMSDAIRRISLRKGYDPSEYALVSFGGAGGQHACGVASKLGIKNILIPADAGLLSAFGLGHSVIERFAEKQVLAALEEIGAQLYEYIDELELKAVNALVEEGVQINQIEIRRRIVNLRFFGQDSTLSIDFDLDQSLIGKFEKEYKAVFGHWPEGRKIEVESIRVVASSKKDETNKNAGSITKYNAESDRKLKLFFRARWNNVPAFERDSLKPGASINGPAVILEDHSTTFIDSGWSARVDGNGTLILDQIEDTVCETDFQEHEIIRLELFTNRFRTIALEMGEMMKRTALSTNIKERLDFSCAILDPEGELVVNAPHIPVHLGALGICVRRVIKEMRLLPGDVIVTNHPAFGGSHLPDVTVITPVFTQDNSLLGFVANRAHHAEIGGARPGSMPPMAGSLAEEGVVIKPAYLVRQGKPQWDSIKNILSGDFFPSRAVEENIADLNAAVAANYKGVAELKKLAEIHGTEVVLHYMKALKDKAEDKVREALLKIPDGIYEASERLDDGTPLRVKINKSGDKAEINFEGSGGVHPGNLNATPAIVNSVVIYVLRLLVDEPLPLNEGLMKAVDLKIPTGILNPDFDSDSRKAPAVVGGNVETSQRLVDTLLKALGLSACSQGTMNNILFGNENYSYYETVCGGCGATNNGDGASAVHSHMTNTRITDPEIIEHRYPVRLENYSIRKNSGGNGKFKGGDGVVREIKFLENMSLSVLTQHRVELPYGINGGQAGTPGLQKIIRSNGETFNLKSIDGFEVSAGDMLRLETPGGGGCDIE